MLYFENFEKEKILNAAHCMINFEVNVTPVSLNKYGHILKLCSSSLPGKKIIYYQFCFVVNFSNHFLKFRTLLQRWIKKSCSVWL